MKSTKLNGSGARERLAKLTIAPTDVTTYTARASLRRFMDESASSQRP